MVGLCNTIDTTQYMIPGIDKVMIILMILLAEMLKSNKTKLIVHAINIKSHIVATYIYIYIYIIWVEKS